MKIQKKLQQFIMKGFAFKNQRTKLKLSNQRSQFNKQNARNDSPNLNLAVTPLPKVVSFEQVSSKNPSATQVINKFTLSRVILNTEGQSRLESSKSLKLSKKSLSENQLSKPKRNNAKVFSVQKPDKNLSLNEIKIPAKLVKSQRDIEDKGSLRQLIEQVILILKRQYIIQQNHIKFYTIRKQNLQDLFGYVLSILSSSCEQKNQALHTRYGNFHFLRTWMAKIGLFMRVQTFKQRQSRLSLTRPSIRFNHTHLTYQAQVDHQKSQLYDILRDKEEIKNKIHLVEEKNSYYKRQIDENIAQIRNQIEKKNHLEQTIEALNIQHDQIKKEIQQHSLFLDHAKKAEQKIANFVNEQNNKMLKLVSEDYRRIQSDIYEYAVYLQSNQLASDLNYEPAPFKVIQDKIMEDLKNINTSIIQDDQLEIQTKNRMMRDFIVLTMQKFKRKDNELLKLLQFKTKCIRKFVSNMQMWLDNWTLKQEYLVNLRNQYLLDTSQLSSKIQYMMKMEICQECKQKQGNLIHSIQELYHKIDLNYKMGNSFY